MLTQIYVTIWRHIALYGISYSNNGDVNLIMNKHWIYGIVKYFMEIRNSRTLC